jgi:hypothetical protein
MPSLLLLILLTWLVPVAAAQTPAPVIRAESLQPRWAREVWVPLRADHREGRSREPLGGFLGPGDEDHRYTGFFLGAGLGLFGTMFSVAWCENADNNCDSTRAVLVGTMASGMFGLGGAVLGGLIPKSPP